MKKFQPLMKGEVDGFDDGMQPLLKMMSREIKKQKTRLGGDFAVAHAVVSRQVISSDSSWGMYLNII